MVGVCCMVKLINYPSVGQAVIKICCSSAQVVHNQWVIYQVSFLFFSEVIYFMF